MTTKRSPGLAQLSLEQLADIILKGKERFDAVALMGPEKWDERTAKTCSPLASMEVYVSIMADMLEKEAIRRGHAGLVNAIYGFDLFAACNLPTPTLDSE